VGKQIFIKVNLVDFNNSLANTHVETLQGLLDFLSPLTGRTIIIGESTAAAQTTTECFEKFGYTVLEKEFNVQLLDTGLGPYTQVNWIKDNLNQVSYPYITSHVIDPTKYCISLARMKTHSLTVCTLAMKNYYMGSTLKFPIGHQLYGTTDSRTLMHWGGGNKGLTQNLVLMSRHFTPDLAIIDGFEGMEGDGPANGTPVDHRVMVAGKDIVSVDRVGIELMGLDYTKVKHVQWAAEWNVGQGDLGRIEIVGPSIDSLRIPYVKSQYYDWSIEWIRTIPNPDWTGVEHTKPNDFKIANYPNPFNSATNIEFDLPSDGRIELDVFSMTGQRVRRLVSDYVRAGTHSVVWDARDDRGRTVSSGTYFVQIETLSQGHVRKMTFIR
jgi:uncharacterized protein (DUF362 family)